MKKFDEIIEWNGLAGGRALTRVQILENAKAPGRVIVIMTEPEDNPGTLVTNGIELLIPRILNDHSLNPHDCLFIEHYPERGIRNPFPETFDRVNFDVERDHRNDWKISRVSWAPIDKELLGAAIGEPGTDWNEL